MGRLRERLEDLESSLASIDTEGPDSDTESSKSKTTEKS
jgi:hypothetical protein